MGRPASTSSWTRPRTGEARPPRRPDVGASDGIDGRSWPGSRGAVIATDENEDAKAGAKAAKRPCEGAHVIALDGVGEDYVSGAGVVRALRDVDLAFERGELVAIVGTSGSGKSTLMNILGCLDRPTRGTSGSTASTWARGPRTRAPSCATAHRLRLPGVQPAAAHYGAQNVELRSSTGVPARARRERAERALAQVGLADRGHHTPSQLSGGQQRRDRPRARDGPAAAAADEPTGNLDTRTSLEALALLQQLTAPRAMIVS